jgi:hypothetical protein
VIPMPSLFCAEPLPPFVVLSGPEAEEVVDMVVVTTIDSWGRNRVGEGSRSAPKGEMSGSRALGGVGCDFGRGLF